MKILKKILLGLLIVIILLVVISFFLPSKIHVERSKIMKATPEVVFAEINNLKNWEKWSPWHQIDPNMQLTYEGPQEGTGAKYSWKSNHKQVGNGSMTITESKPYEMIKTSMDFMENGKGDAWYKIEKMNEGTKVTWGMESDLGMNPIARYFGLMMDKMIGPDFEKGLNNLDSVSQNSAPKIEMKIVPNQFIISLKATYKTNEDVGKNMQAMYEEIMKYMQANKIEQIGPPICVFHKYEPGKEIIVEAGIPVAKKMTTTSGKIKCTELKGGNTVMAYHYGPYDKLEATYDAIHKWMQENEKTPTGAPWEVYVTDPTTVKNPNEILTEVYYPIQ